MRERAKPPGAKPPGAKPPGAKPPGAGAEQQAERIASFVFLVSRGGQLVFSTLMFVNDRRRYARPVLQAGILAGVALESGWLGRRILRAQRYDDRRGMWLDTASTAAALIVSQRGLGSDAVAPWAKNVAIGAAAGAATARRMGESVGAMTMLCAAAMATGVRAGGRDAHVAGVALAANDAVSWAGMHVATRVYLTAHRRYARFRDQAVELAVERAQATAAEAERSRQHELLHRVTIGVFGRIAASADLAGAVAIARAEAARLRFALRTGGRVAEGFDRALADLAQEAAGLGLRAELVTAELTSHPDPEVGAVLRDATRRALQLARELGGAPRAVVRALSTDEGISVTVRDHGVGFAPDSGDAYETMLLAIGAPIAQCGGALSIWSEPGEGVRVGLTVPLTATASTASTAVGVVEVGAQSHRGDAPVADAPLAGLTKRGIVRADITFAQLPPAQTRLADRTLLAALLTWRVTGLTTGAVALIAGGARYRNRRVALLQLVLASGESLWFAARALGRARWSDSTAARVDAATAIGVLALGQWNVPAADRATWINWAPWSFAANVVSGQAMGVARPATAALGAATVIGTYAAQGPRPGDAVANSAALGGFFVGALSFATQIRTGAVRLEQARAAAVDEGRKLAEAHEQAVQLRLLHDHAVQTLETIAGGRFTDLESVRQRAAAEAAQLERDLDQRHRSGRSLLNALTLVVAEHTARGLVVDVDCPGALDVDPALCDALCGATGEALTNVGKHAETMHAAVSAGIHHGRVAVTIADQGAGFDPHASHGGFGMNESIRRRMHDVGGAVVVESAPATGTRVTLSGPA